jgi:hypothetical protein
MATITGSKRLLSISTDSTAATTTMTLGGVGVATEGYVTTQISNLVASAPGTLDTLNELAAALGDDASFSTTVSTALGNRLRIDTNAQGLNSTQKANGRTNLGLGTASTSATGDFAAASHNQAWSTITGTPTTISGYGITDAFNGAYSSLTGLPTLGTAAATASTDYATATQGATADAALPKAGGTVTGSILLQDNVELRLGTDTDLKMYHDGTVGRIANNTGHLYIQNLSDDKDIYLRSDDGTGGLTTYLNIDGSLGQVSVSKPFVALDGASISGTLYSGSDLTIGDGTTQSRLIIKKADNNVSDHIQFYNGTTLMGEIGCEDTSWLRINQETDKNIYTPRYIRADNGFFVDGTSKGIDGSGNFIGGTITGASDANVANWNTAFGWGDHSAAGYITSQRAISSTPTDGATTTAISSDWAFDNVKTAVPANAVFTDTVNTFDGAYSSLTGTPSTFAPSAHNQAWSTITGTPTTISGYGITDAFNGAYSSLSGIPSTFAPSAHNQAWSTITGTPTTIAGYGISDAFIDWKLVDGSNVATTIRSDKYIRFNGSAIGGSGTQADPYAVDTPNTTYTADGNYGMTLNGTAFRLEDDRRRNSSTTDIYTGNTHDYTFYDADIGIRWYTANAEEMRLEDDGDLHVDGDVIAFSTTVSDARLKDDVQTIENATEKVNKLRGVSYTWNQGSRKGQREIGVIAQEVEEVVPEIVHEKKLPFVGDETYKTVDYEKLVALLIESNKELTARVEQLEARLDGTTK